MSARPRFEIALVVVIAAAVLVPGIWRYSLVDPWETHYGEVGRMMLQNHDWVHTEWPQDNEGFRSKPVLSFWLMAAGMRAFGVAQDGGYSGEMADSAWVMIGMRLPFVLSAIAGLALMWWMLARLVSRRLAWLALLVVGSCPVFCLVSRQAIPDMPLAACVMGALAMFVMANEDGDRPIAAFGQLRIPGTDLRIGIDARHVLFAIAGGFVVVQAIYYRGYFMADPPILAVTRLKPTLLPVAMLVLLATQARDGWTILRLPLIALGGLGVELRGTDHPPRAADQSRWRYAFDVVLASWERHSPDRYVIRGLVMPMIWALGGAWSDTDPVADRALRMKPLTTMHQVYMLWCYALLGVSVLAKGPPGLAVVGGVGVLHTIVLWRWNDLYEGGLEIKRGLIFMVVTFMPWHLAMYLRDGARFVEEYWGTHILSRAAVGVDNSPGTFEYYFSQIGHGMWLWAALLPAAFGVALFRAKTDTREGRVRLTILLWAIVAVAVFSLIQTKFHHYILPAIPALAIVVAWFLDDILAGRERLHPLFAAIGVAIVFLICRDLAFEPERWIEMFVFRYDRPWPSAEPWAIDLSDPFIALGIVAAVAIVVASLRWVRIGVGALCVAGLAICIWSLQVYMPHAGTHWGMRDAIRTYYKERTIYGAKIIYYGAGQLADEWSDHDDTYRFDSFIPDALQVGQPMTIVVQINKADDDRAIESAHTLIGVVSAIGDHSVELALRPGERHRLDGAIARGKQSGSRGRPPVRIVDADRLIAWQLYWRGENFWSGDEIWGFAPEMKTAFVKTDNVEFGKYLADRARAPLGRRYFVVTEAGRITSIKNLLTTPRAKDSYEVIDTTSNKFSLGSFWL